MMLGMRISRRPVAGCLYGLALGDALAAPTEFLTVEEIVDRFGDDGPVAPLGDPAQVTDDTQMALAVGRALQAVTAGPLTAATLEGPLRAEFVAWLQSPDNNRAPGATCLQACRALAAGAAWEQATVPASKGCGANMRVAPVGFLAHGVTGGDATSAAVAQYQAAFTHGHPTALAASDLTARAVSELLAGCQPAELPGRLRRYARDQRTVWHADWLAGLWRRPGVDRSEQFIARGWDECLASLDRLDAALLIGDRAADPCRFTGAGWVAEEALATGLLCFLLLPDDPVAAIRRAAVSSGDSDSIACLTGAFAGAAHGVEAWPHNWRRRIEYRCEIEVLAAAWEVQ
jgi:ADP-ribosylglycohydrolase